MEHPAEHTWSFVPCPLRIRNPFTKAFNRYAAKKIPKKIARRCVSSFTYPGRITTTLAIVIPPLRAFQAYRYALEYTFRGLLVCVPRNHWNTD